MYLPRIINLGIDEFASAQYRHTLVRILPCIKVHGAFLANIEFLSNKKIIFG